MGEINLRVPPKKVELEITLSDAAMNTLSSCVSQYCEVQRQMLSAAEKRDDKRDHYRSNLTGWLIFLLLVGAIVYGIKVW